MSRELRFDEIGIWSEVKLEILKKYADAYSKILSAQGKVSLFHVYIDAFAGAGKHVSKATQLLVTGSPLNALAVRPQFREFHLIDIKSQKIENLRTLIGERKDVFLYQGDSHGHGKMAHVSGVDEAIRALADTSEFNAGVCSLSAAYMVGNQR
jgi:three-Cys-motif partner protein